MLIIKHKPGFTVPQLLIAISILIIFAVLLVPNFLGRVRQAQTVRLFHDAALVEDAAEQYHLANQNESWPITGEPLAQLDIDGDIIQRPGKPPLPPDFWERVNLATFNPEHPNAIALFVLNPSSIARHARLRHNTNNFVFRPDTGDVYVVGGIIRPVVPPPPPATGRPPIAIIGGNFRIGDTTFSAQNPPRFSVEPQPGIRNVQWHNNRESFPPGEHTVSVRVQYDDGTWSDWTDYSFTVIASPPPPAPPQTAMPAPTTRSIITTSTPMNWTYDQSYDLDGHAIIAAQWENRRIYYPVGEQVVRLRVQNSLRLWSDWTTVSFNVVPTILPTAVITMSPTANINSLTVLSFNANTSIEPNGDTITAREWQLNNGDIAANPPGGQFPAGTHTVRLRVRNNAGYWSAWVQQSFNVTTEEIATLPFFTDPTTFVDPAIWNTFNTVSTDGQGIVVGSASLLRHNILSSRHAFSMPAPGRTLDVRFRAMLSRTALSYHVFTLGGIAFYHRWENQTPTYISTNLGLTSLGADFSGVWREYHMEITSTQVRFFIDGVLRATRSHTQTGNHRFKVRTWDLNRFSRLDWLRIEER